jgi:cytochrome bd ubiquinol oxidase subunit II
MIHYPFDLPTAWFILIGVLLTGYAILDGFDLGAGALHLFAKKDHDRRIVLNAIGPVWDGNEVWLLTGGGALFAAFPNVYASAFSGFYTAFMLVLMGIIFRAVAIEFRSKEESTRWRGFWDKAFAIASIALSVLMGVALGNLVIGVPVDASGEYAGTFWTLLSHPYPIIVGVTTLAMFMLHGSIYLVLKTQGEFHQQVRKWVKNSMIFYFISYAILTIATFIFAPQMAAKFQSMPFLIILPILNILALANVPREIHHGRDFLAFLSSCFSIVANLTLFGIGMFPAMLPSNPNPANSLTIMNSASSTASLTIMMTIAVVGVPFVLAYTAGIYWVFRGKVDETHMHY